MSLVLQINPSLSKPKALSKQEALLLEQIELAIPIETWERYHILRKKRQTETINTSESVEYAAINQQIEAANVKRLILFYSTNQ